MTAITEDRVLMSPLEKLEAMTTRELVAEARRVADVAEAATDEMHIVLNYVQEKLAEADEVTA